MGVVSIFNNYKFKNNSNSNNHWFVANLLTEETRLLHLQKLLRNLQYQRLNLLSYLLTQSNINSTFVLAHWILTLSQTRSIQTTLKGPWDFAFAPMLHIHKNLAKDKRIHRKEVSPLGIPPLFFIIINNIN